MKNKIIKVSSILLITLLLFLPLLSFYSYAATSNSETYESLSDLKGKRIGVQTGTVTCDLASENIQDCELVYFNNNEELVSGLDSGSIDAYLIDEPISKYFNANYTNQIILAQLSNDDYGFAFSNKNSDICEKFNAFLNQSHENGFLDYLESKWMGGYEKAKVSDYSSLTTGENGVLEFATSIDTAPPFSYTKNGQLVGYDIDLAVEFCKENGYGIHITNYSISELINVVQDGKADFAAGCITITNERKEHVLFSNSYYSGGIVVVVKNLSENNTSLLESFYGKKIGILTGTKFDMIAEDTITDCKVMYYNNMPDQVEALKEGKIDAFIADEPIIGYIVSNNSSIKQVACLQEEQYAFVFGKNNDKILQMHEDLNEYLEKSRENGFLNYLKNKWVYGSEDGRKYDPSAATLDNAEKTIVYATCADVGAPFCYYKNGEVIGLEIELVCEFAKEYGYNIEIVNYSMTGILGAAQSGVVDFAGCCVSITEERKETMLFSNVYYEGGIAIAALRDTVTNEKVDFFQSILTSFEKTFIRENRWEMFLEGIGNTMIITVSSIILGMILGFITFIICRKGKKLSNAITRFCYGIVQRMPVVVLLMIFYYLILGKLISNGIIISIICFSLTFAAAFFGILETGVKAVGKDQFEAGFALGFSNIKIFTRIILPQAARHFIPLLKAEIITHIKATAIVGYIAITDLTRISDVIRSRTFEAFFPLIATAIIYFAIEELLVFVVRNIEFGLNKKKRHREIILKGVDTNEN